MKPKSTWDELAKEWHARRARLVAACAEVDANLALTTLDTRRLIHEFISELKGAYGPLESVDEDDPADDYPWCFGIEWPDGHEERVLEAISSEPNSLPLLATWISCLEAHAAVLSHEKQMHHKRTAAVGS